MKNYLIKTLFWSKKLNEKNNFCINACMGGLTFFNKWVTKLDIFFHYVNNLSMICIGESSRINENGLDLQIDYFLHELTYLYSDFAKMKKTNVTEARKYFFGSDNFKLMLKDINVPYSYAFETLCSAIYDDMLNLTKFISFYDSIFIFSTLLIYILFLIFLIFMIILNDADKQILIFITKIIKRNY